MSIPCNNKKPFIKGNSYTCNNKTFIKGKTSKKSTPVRKVITVDFSILSLNIDRILLITATIYETLSYLSGNLTTSTVDSA